MHLAFIPTQSVHMSMANNIIVTRIIIGSIIVIRITDQYIMNAIYIDYQRVHDQDVNSSFYNSTLLISTMLID